MLLPSTLKLSISVIKLLCCASEMWKAAQRVPRHKSYFQWVQLHGLLQTLMAGWVHIKRKCLS